MDGLGELLVVAGAMVGAGYWVIYRLLTQLGGILTRLEALEMQARRLKIPGVRFQVGNQFEADNILDALAFRDEYRISGQRFSAEDVIIDVGAHIGVFSYLCHLRGSRKIYSYEPSERNFRLLEKNVCSRMGVHCLRAAVWRSDSEDTDALRLSGPIGDNTGANSVLAGGALVDFPNQQLLARFESTERVDVISLDSILEQFARVKLLKLDCEGSEFPILLTSRRLDRVERIVGEIHECNEQLMQLLAPASRVPGYPVYRAANLAERLESIGFRVTIHSGGEHMYEHTYLFDAHRSEAARLER